MVLRPANARVIKEIKLSDNLSVGLFYDGRVMTMIRGKPFVQCRGAVVQGRNEDAIAERMGNFHDTDEFLANRTPEEKKLDDQMVHGKIHLVDPETELFVHASNLQAWVDNDYNLDLIDSRIAFPILLELYKFEDKAENALFYEIERRWYEGSYFSRKAMLLSLNSSMDDKKIANTIFDIVLRSCDFSTITLRALDYVMNAGYNLADIGKLPRGKLNDVLMLLVDMRVTLVINRFYFIIDEIVVRSYDSPDKWIKKFIMDFGNVNVFINLLMKEKINITEILLEKQKMILDELTTKRAKDVDSQEFLRRNIDYFWHIAGNKEKRHMVINHLSLIESAAMEGKIKFTCLPVKISKQKVNQLFADHFLEYLSPPSRMKAKTMPHDDGHILAMTRDSLTESIRREYWLKPFDDCAVKLNTYHHFDKISRHFIIGEIHDGFLTIGPAIFTNEKMIDACSENDGEIYMKKLLGAVQGEPTRFFMVYVPHIKMPREMRERDALLDEISDNLREKYDNLREKYGILRQREK